MRHNETPVSSRTAARTNPGREALAKGVTPLAIAVMAVLGQAAQAATIEVTTTAQKVGGPGGCSLQEAIWAANLGESKAIEVELADAYGETDQVLEVDTECVIEPNGSNTYTIVLPAGEEFTLTSIVDDPTNYTGPTATPLVFSDVVIEANGALLQRASAAPNFRAFAVGSLLFQDGRRTGSLTLRNAHIKGFVAKGGNGSTGGGGGLGAGGAIYVHAGDLTVESSTFEGNGALGGNGSRGRWTGGGGGGLGGSGGVAEQGGGGGGGGARGDGGEGESDCGEPCLGLGAGGGGGGGTVEAGDGGSNTQETEGGLACGGKGGYATLNPLNSPRDGQDGRCPGGGGGGGRDSFFGFAEVSGGYGGDGHYGGGGGGGAYRMTAGNAGRGGFGGGGGGAHIFDGNLSGFGPDGGDGGFGGGGGAAAGGYQPIGGGGPGSGGSFAGSASRENGGGGAGLGGAIFNHAGDVRVENSTFTGNYAVRGVAGSWPNDPDANSGRDQGGAIFSVGGSLTVLNSTIAANEGTSSTQGGAGVVVYAPGFDIFADPGTEETRFTLRNTIIAGNVAGSQVVRECRLINSDDNEVIFEGSGNLITANDNCTPGVVTASDPMLGTLQLNLPGMTKTMAIGASSPALDAADPATALLLDQRGLERPAGNGPDIGAFEFGAVATQCADVTVSAGASCTAEASVDAGSFSPDGGGVTLSQDPAGPFGLGDTLVTLTATSANGVVGSCTATVSVVDDAPPVVTATLATAALSPSTQHNLVNVGLAATATDGCSTAPTSFQVQVFGDEDDEAPTSSKGTVFSPDAAEMGIGTLRLRAERSDAGDGRVYLIVTSGVDGTGNVGRACSTVVVPLSNSAASLAAVNAQATAARAACVSGNGARPAGYFVIGDGPARAPRPKR